MSARDISIHLIFRSQKTNGFDAWLRELGVSEEFIEQVPDGLTEGYGAALVGTAAKRCYMSFEPGMNPNVTKVRRDWHDYLTNILESGHGSVLEHATCTFAIEGVTRVFTGEMNRHRAGWAISEGSMRYIRYQDQVPFWMPKIFRAYSEDSEELKRKKYETESLFRRRFLQMADDQRYLADLWGIEDMPFSEKKRLTSAFRRLIGMGVSTGGIWTGNLRALRHVIALRCNEHAEEEIAHVFTEIGKHMVDAEPMLFGDFKQDDQGFWRPKYPKV